MSYISPVQELLILTFYNAMKGFFTTIQQIVYIKAICFLLVFTLIYLWIFITFLGTLHEEILLTHGIVNMIPTFVLENNPKVREQVWKRKGMKLA